MIRLRFIVNTLEGQFKLRRHLCTSPKKWTSGTLRTFKWKSVCSKNKCQILHLSNTLNQEEFSAHGSVHNMPLRSFHTSVCSNAEEISREGEGTQHNEHLSDIELPLVAQKYLESQPKSLSTNIEVEGDNSLSEKLNKYKENIEQQLKLLELRAKHQEYLIDRDLELDSDDKSMEHEENGIDVEELSASISDTVTPTTITSGKSKLKLSVIADPSVPVSDAPCPGCGALLHCKDATIPGFLPSNKFSVIPQELLVDTHCQRCQVYNNHKVLLDLKVSPKEYHKVISQIKHERALVVMIMDVLDIDNYIIRGLRDLINTKQPLYIVGNKVDLLPKDAPGYLEKTKDYLLQACLDAGLDPTGKLIKHVALISAKSGYGVEELVTKLMNDWSRKGHVYLVGCTNAGKSTLFNAMLQSDYCNSTAREFVHRATASVWPGTTMNLLKFPIVDPAPWRLARRTQRIIKQRTEEVQELRLLQQASKNLDYTQYGYIGQTFVAKKASDEYQGFSLASYSLDPKADTLEEGEAKQPVAGELKYQPARYARWCHDTPGLVNPQQIINILTEYELSKLQTTKKLVPRTFILKPTQVMFLSGLGRIDYLEGEKSIFFTVFASRSIPVHVLPSEEADQFYKENLGKEKLLIPSGDEDRLNRLPSLVGKEFNVDGIGWEKSAADIVMSSLGWVAITIGSGASAKLRAFTPGRAGLSLREPALLDLAVNLRGKRKKGTPRYEIRKPGALNEEVDLGDLREMVGQKTNWLRR